LLDILETEHEALMAGAAGQASALLKPKMDAMNAFDELMADPAQLTSVPEVRPRMERIVRLASENAELFSAVRNGVGQAVSRIGSATTNAYVGAYTPAGGKTAFSKAAGGYTKKA
jgi:hypothetical protein